MKNLAIFGLAAASVALAEGSLWSLNAKNLQVQTPEAVACVPPAADDYSFCPEHTAGWWFAYVGDTKDGQKMGFAPVDYNADGTYKLITTDEKTGDILPNGNIQEGVGLVVSMSAAGGASSTPAIAGIGWNWTKAETPISIADKSGLCFAYSWDGSIPLQVELGMPTDVEKATNYDTWYAKLAPQSGAVADLPWEKFLQDAYDAGKKDLDFAKQNNVSVKIRIKNPDAAEVKGTLTINEVGWVGECKSGSAGAGSAITPGGAGAGTGTGTGAGTGTGDVTPIMAAAQSSVKAILSGRTLSFSGIQGKASVEIVNLQGQVLLKGAVSAASSMSLANLDAGVYMVRVAGKAVNMNQKILVK